MLDNVTMTVQEYSDLQHNIRSILKQDPKQAINLFNSEELSLKSFVLNISGLGERALNASQLAFHYNSVKKVLRVDVGIGFKIHKHISFLSWEPVCNPLDGMSEFQIQYQIDTPQEEADYVWWTGRCDSIDVTPLNMAADFSKAFWAINFYIKNIPEVVKTIEEKKEETYVEKKKGNKRYKNRIVLQKTIYIHVKKFNKSEIKHVIKCLCWGVRGHFRYYKNGKVAWVKPYRKGKERNNDATYAGKEYVL